MGVVHQLVSIIFIAYVVSCNNELKYEVDASLAGRVCPPGQRVFEGTVASFLSCAIASDEAGSAGIAYIKGTLMCYGCDVMSMLQTGGFQNLPGAVFYRRDPLPVGGDIAAVGGNLMKITKTGMSYDDAEIACAEYGGLAKINTAAKQVAMENFLLDENNGFKGLDYWIQCRLSSYNVWRYDDGSLVPMTNDFWHPGEPGDNDTKCCYMWGRFNYKWDNIVCAFQKGYICELT